MTMITYNDQPEKEKKHKNIVYSACTTIIFLLSPFLLALCYLRLLGSPSSSPKQLSMEFSSAVLNTSFQLGAINEKSKRRLLRKLTDLNTAVPTEAISLIPAFTLFFYPPPGDFALSFSKDALFTLTIELENAFNSCLPLLPTTDEKPAIQIDTDDFEDLDLSSAYQSIFLMYNSQIFPPSSSLNEQSGLENQTISLQDSGTYLAVTYSTFLTFQFDKRNQLDPSSTEILQKWLISSFLRCEQGPQIVDTLKKTGFDAFQWLYRANIALPIQGSNQNQGKIKKKSESNRIVIVAAVVGCIVAGATCAYILLFGGDCSQKKKDKEKKEKGLDHQVSRNTNTSKYSNFDEYKSQKREKNVSSRNISFSSESNSKSHDLSYHRHKVYPKHSKHLDNSSYNLGSQQGSASRKSRNHSNVPNTRKVRKKKNKGRHVLGATYSMSSISSGSLLTISEDDRDRKEDKSLSDTISDKNSYFENERLFEAFKMLQTKNPKDSIPFEIIYKNPISGQSRDSNNSTSRKNHALDPDSKDQPNEREPNPFESFLFRTKKMFEETKAQSDDEKKDNNNIQQIKIEKSHTFDSMSSLGESQHGINNEVNKQNRQKRDSENRKSRHDDERGRNKAIIKENDQGNFFAPFFGGKHNEAPQISKEQEKFKQAEAKKGVEGDITSADAPDSVMRTLVKKSKLHRRPLPSLSGFDDFEELSISAPRGKLGVYIVVISKGEPSRVHSVKDTSVIFDRVKVGDVLMKIDGIDVSK